MEILGLPVHILVLHFAVVLAPLMALGALWYVARPVRRRWLAQPLSVLALVATVMTVATGHFGEELEKAMPAEETIKTHALYGGIAEKVVAALFVALVLTILAFDARPKDRFPFLSGAHGVRWVQLLGSIMTVLLAVATLAVIYLAGHSGAYSAWHGWRG